MQTIIRTGVLPVLKQAVASPLAAGLTIFALAIIVPVGWFAVNWLFLDGVWSFSDAEVCKVRSGICWPFVAEKLRFIVFGTYPYDEQWRPAIVSVLLCGLSVQVGLQMIGRGIPLSVLQSVWLWVVCLALCFGLMSGGAFGLPHVDAVRWNGLPILLILSIVSIALAFPFGILLALARTQTRYPVLVRLAAVYTEIARGVPMLTVLFVGVFVLPLVLPPGTRISAVAATLVALILFHAAYFAEDVRSGLRSLPQGQFEAAKALSLSYWQANALVLLPQAVRRSLPALMNTIIGAYKDTSLVVVLGIHDLTATARMSFSDPEWRSYALEAYVLIGVWFLISCAFLSWIGRRLHTQKMHP